MNNAALIIAIIVVLFLIALIGDVATGKYNGYPAVILDKTYHPAHTDTSYIHTGDGTIVPVTSTTAESWTAQISVRGVVESASFSAGHFHDTAEGGEDVTAYEYVGGWMHWHYGWSVK